VCSRSGVRDTTEIELLRALRPHPELTIAGGVLDVDVGVVTGLNKFIVLTEHQTYAAPQKHFADLTTRSLRSMLVDDEYPPLKINLKEMALELEAWGTRIP
jgi:hypothetical protein